MDLQAQDRAHRIGQKSEVKVLRLITNSWIEEEILSKAAFKMNLDEIFIQAGLYNQRSTDVERRERLVNISFLISFSFPLPKINTLFFLARPT